MSLLHLPAFGTERPWVQTAVLRPELGSLVAAALLFIFFSIASSGAMVEIPTIARVLDTAWPYGIIAVAVGLLMISGEFDLSAGVMVGTAGALLGVAGAVVFGGVGTLAVVAAWWMLFPELRGINRFAEIRPDT